MAKIPHKKLVKLMGQVVTVHKTVHRERYPREGKEEDGFRWVEILPILHTDWTGWVTGFRYKQEGHWDWMTHNSDCYGPEHECYFNPTKNIPLLMVTPWPTMKHKWVPMDSYTLGGTPQSPAHQYTEKDREEMAKWTKDQPRGVNGRWS